jgi:hypothetical protein
MGKLIIVIIVVTGRHLGTHTSCCPAPCIVQPQVLAMHSMTQARVDRPSCMPVSCGGS